jgi:hypothetical protein
MDSVSHKLAIWTLVLVAVEVLVLVPTMLRELADLFAKNNMRKVRRVMDELQRTDIGKLRLRCGLKDDALLDALYSLRERGEVNNSHDPSGSEMWFVPESAGAVKPRRS